MKNPFASLKKLKKKEVMIFGGILAVLLVVFVVRKQSATPTQSIPYFMAGDSNETRNQLADMEVQNQTAINSLKDTINSQGESFKQMFEYQADKTSELEELTNNNMINLKDSFNDIVSYVGDIKNSVPNYDSQFTAVDNKIDKVIESNNALKDTIAESTKNVAPASPPVSKGTTFGTGSYGDVKSAQKAMAYMESVGGKDVKIIPTSDGKFRAVATYEDTAKATRVGINLKDKKLTSIYYVK